MATLYGTAVYGTSLYGDTSTGGGGTVATLAQLKAHLNITSPTTDAQLALFLEVATDLAERYTGRPWTPRSVTQVADGGKSAILLHGTPVQSIDAVVENGTALAVGTWTVDASAGILYRGGPTSTGVWACGYQNVSVTYTAGPASAPATVRHAILELARHLWDTQRGGSQLPRQAGAGDEWDPRAGFSMPRRVVELLDVHRAAGFS